MSFSLRMLKSKVLSFMYLHPITVHDSNFGGEKTPNLAVHRFQSMVY